MDSPKEIYSVEDLEHKLSRIEIPWEDVAPQTVVEWLDMYAKSHGTCKELLLAAMLPCTSALLGNATVKLFDAFKEKGNLFLIGLAPSGTGKTPACNIGCVTPLISHLEPRVERSLLVDETSANGLFNHFVNNQRGNQVHVPVLCIDEGYSFTNKLVSTSKSASQTSLTMERMCKLYDGDYWFTVKGTKGKRSGVQSARMSMITYTTPRRFLTDVWPKVVASRNGLADRILLLYKGNEHPVDIEAMEKCSRDLQSSSLKGLGTVYEQMYQEHQQEKSVEYILSPQARELYLKYCKVPGQDHQNAAGNFTPQCNAKRGKNALKIALNLHVLWHRIGTALIQRVRPTPIIISESTLNMALSLHDTFLAFGGVAEACLKLQQGSGGIKMTVSPEDIKNRILTLPGPYTTSKRIYNSFSSSSRPSTQNTQACLEDLEKESLGFVKKVQKSTFFYKAIPTTLVGAQEKLGMYNISLESYIKEFTKKDDLLTNSQMEKLDEHNPQPNALRDYILDSITS